MQNIMNIYYPSSVECGRITFGLLSNKFLVDVKSLFSSFSHIPLSLWNKSNSPHLIIVYSFIKEVWLSVFLRICLADLSLVSCTNVIIIDQDDALHTTVKGFFQLINRSLTFTKVGRKFERINEAMTMISE
jgi:hypothetical protein